MKHRFLTIGAITLVLVGILLLKDQNPRPQVADLSQAIENSPPPTPLPQRQRIVWVGEIREVRTYGRLLFENLTPNPEYKYFIAEPPDVIEDGGLRYSPMTRYIQTDEIVRVTGLLYDPPCDGDDIVGDNEYRGCVPWVEIEKIEPAETSSAASMSDAQVFAQMNVDDWIRLGLGLASPSVGYGVGLPKLPRLTWTDRTILRKYNNDIVDIHYPQFDGEPATTRLNDSILSIIAAAQESARKSLAGRLVDFPEMESIAGVNLAIRYRVIGVVNGIVSMEIVITDYSMGGNGNHDETHIINWDLKANRPLESTELFCSKNYLNTLIPIARKGLIDAFNQNENIAVHPIPSDMVNWINEGTSASPSNWEHFLLNDRGLIPVFPSYQVSSGASGIVRILIPNSAIPRLLCLP